MAWYTLPLGENRMSRRSHKWRRFANVGLVSPVPDVSSYPTPPIWLPRNFKLLKPSTNGEYRYNLLPVVKNYPALWRCRAHTVHRNPIAKRFNIRWISSALPLNRVIPLPYYKSNVCSPGRVWLHRLKDHKKIVCRTSFMAKLKEMET